MLEEALDEFVGTVLVISHDRYFVDKVVDRVVELRDGQFYRVPRRVYRLPEPGLTKIDPIFHAWFMRDFVNQLGPISQRMSA